MVTDLSGAPEPPGAEPQDLSCRRCQSSSKAHSSRISTIYDSQLCFDVSQWHDKWELNLRPAEACSHTVTVSHLVPHAIDDLCKFHVTWLGISVASYICE